MSSNAQATVSSSQPSFSKAQLQAFEFTKRKRWADLLVNELPEAIIFMLSPACRVLFCTAALTELLGWRDQDLVDHHFTEFVNADDQNDFRTSFFRAVEAKTDITSHIRLRRKIQYSQDSDFIASTTPDVLVELKGHGHWIPGNECSYFILVAKPYPSRNTAMINTLLELKMENERLQQRVAELRLAAENRGTIDDSGQVLPSMQPPRTVPSVTIPPQYYGDFSNPSSASVSAGTCYDNTMQRRSTIDATNSALYGGRFGSTSALSSADDEMFEDGFRKKKLKKMQSTEQYVCVTCGRTDSPEWRKGPHGPKTLCNACGLRWAKQMRRYDEEHSGEGSQGQGSSSTVTPQ